MAPLDNPIDLAAGSMKALPPRRNAALVDQIDCLCETRRLLALLDRALAGDLEEIPLERDERDGAHLVLNEIRQNVTDVIDWLKQHG